MEENRFFIKDNKQKTEKQQQPRFMQPLKKHLLPRGTVCRNETDAYCLNKIKTEQWSQKTSQRKKVSKRTPNSQMVELEEGAT